MAEKKYEEYYSLADKASSDNWESVKGSGLFGCCYCGGIFPSSAVTKKLLDGDTVLCPRCYNEFVIGDASGIPVREDVLEELHDWFFGADYFRVLRTERLFIRPVMQPDAADILEIRGDMETADAAGVPRMESLEDAMDYIAEYSENGRGLAVVLGGEVIGLIERYEDYELGGEFLGYYMKKSHRRKGYMTEALTALRNRWVEEGTETPMLWIFPGNDASCRVAEKSGWTYLGCHVVDINCLNQAVYFYG